MERIGKHLLSFFWLLCFSCPLLTLWGQVSFEAIPSSTQVSQDERFTVSFIITISSNGTKRIDTPISLPDFDGFDVLSQGIVEQSSFSNGTFSRKVGYDIILQPKKSGKLKIKPATVKVDGKTYSTKPITIMVKEGEIKKRKNINPYSREAFLEIELENENPYVNQATQADFVLYTKDYSLIRRIKGLNPPKFNGLSAVKLPHEERVEQVFYKGDVYIKLLLESYSLFPQRPGELEISPFSVVFLVSDGFFSTTESEMSSESKTLICKPLPTNAPRSFNGAVGEFTRNASLDKFQLSTRQKVELEQEIIGSGNLHFIKIPEPIVTSEVEKFSTFYREAFQPSHMGYTGKIIAKTPLVPIYGGEHEVVIPEFSFFNPEERAYKTLPPQTFKIRVDGITKKQSDSLKKLNNESNLVASNDSTSSPLAIISEPFEELISEDNPSIFPYLVIILLLVAIIVVLLVILRRKNRRKTIPFASEASDSQPVNTGLSGKELKQYFKNLEDALSGGNPSVYFDTLDDFLKKLRLHFAERMMKWQPETIERLEEITTITRQQKFSPIPTESPQIIHFKLKDLLDEIGF